MALVKVWDSVLGWTNINISHKHYKADILDFSHSLLEHTVSGLTTGHVLQATSSTTYGFASLPSHMHTKSQISDFAHTHDDRYFLRTSKLKLGNYFQNVISSELSGNASEIIIKTRIKFEPSLKMPMIHLEGYFYGHSTTIDMKIAFYVYAPPGTSAAAFYLPTYVCLSRWQPEVKLFTYTEEKLIGTYIGIAIVGNMYFPRFTVNYLDLWNGSNSRDETDNWSVKYNRTDVSMLNATDIRDYDNETALGYSYLATNISGNLWGNADSASKVNNKLTVGSKQFDGSAPVTITLSDFDISSLVTESELASKLSDYYTSVSIDGTFATKDEIPIVPAWALKPSLDIDDIPTIPHTKLSGVINYQNLEAILSDYRTAVVADATYATKNELTNRLGAKADLVDGKVPASQLPSFVDDVLEYSAKANFPSNGESGKIYVDLSTNLTWRWSGTAYVEISPSLALGETSATAYRGDRGKIAYDHSQSPHNYLASNGIAADSYKLGGVLASQYATITYLTSNYMTSNAIDNNYATKSELNNRVPVEIKGTYDCNNLITPGFYTITGGNVGITHAPVNDSFSIIVSRTGDPANGTYIHQLAMQDSTHNVYVRYYNGSTWSEWRKLLYADEKAYDTTRVDGREVKYYTQSQFASITPVAGVHYVIYEN